MATPLTAVHLLIRRVRPLHDDCWTDRVHYVLAPAVLTSMALFHVLKQHFGSPVECIVPQEMASNKHWMNYIHGLCFVEDTYFVPMDESFPMRVQDREQRAIHYYQWTPFVLAAMALLFVLPKIIFNAFMAKAGINIGHLLDHCQALERRVKGEKAKVMKWVGDKAGSALADQLDQTVRFNANWRTLGKFSADDYEKWESGSPRMRDNRVASLYLSFKVFNLAIVVLQFWLLNKFFCPDEHFLWGFGVVVDIMAGRDWWHTRKFPRVTFCDIEIRKPHHQLQDKMRYSVQCLLPMNMFNEKMYLFLWFGLFFLAAFSALGLFIWARRIFVWRLNGEFVTRHLRRFMGKKASIKFAGEMDRFVRFGLGRDMCTTLRLIDLNCSPLVTTQLIGRLWELYSFKGPALAPAIRIKPNSAEEKSLPVKTPL